MHVVLEKETGIPATMVTRTIVKIMTRTTKAKKGIEGVAIMLHTMVYVVLVNIMCTRTMT